MGTDRNEPSKGEQMRWDDCMHARKHAVFSIGGGAHLTLILVWFGGFDLILIENS